jgi:fermentation-respiration switch protein FrsA (DUF1100 family)
MNMRASFPSLLILLLLASVAAADDIVMRDVLVLEPVGRGGRVPFPTDALQARIAAGDLTAPEEGDEVAAPGGAVRVWAAARAEDGSLSSMPALRGGYVYWPVEVERDGFMILRASGHGAAWVNGEWRVGDPYRTGWTLLPVALRAGRNDILFHCRRGALEARLEPAPGPVLLHPGDRTLPDLVAGEPWPVLGAIIVINASNEPARGLVLRTGGSGLPTRESDVPEIPPCSVRKVPFWLGGALPPGTSACDMRVELSRGRGGASEHLDETTIAMRVVEPDARHRRTFISEIDGSVQYYAVVPARPEPGDARPGLILTLHGAGVEAAGQAAVYAPKPWAHVVAPTNRRPFGFDWEDWGRLDALEVLERSRGALDADPQHIALTGHSMGGHGAWSVGSTLTDRFAAVGPSAGWISFWSYVGAAALDGGDPVARLMHRATNPSRTEALLENLLARPVYVLHGEDDDNVPVEQARSARERLAERHPAFAYHEEAGAGHWWGNRCCDWAPMMEMFRESRRPADTEVEHISFRTANPAVASRFAWAVIEQQQDALAISAVDLTWEPGAQRVVGATENVARLTLDLEATPGRPRAVDLDGATVSPPSDVNASRLHLVRIGTGPWEIDPDPLPAAVKGPHRAGPFKDAFRHRMLFVYGTGGDAAENAWAQAKARYDAETFWYRGNGAVDIVPDTSFSAEASAGRSVVLYGNAETNRAWTVLLEESPVVIGRGFIAVGDRRLEGADLACLLVRPRADDERACVVAIGGSGIAGMRLTDRLPYFVSGVAYPDWTVLGPEVLTSGLDGVRGCGFFGNDWSLERGAEAWREDE